MVTVQRKHGDSTGGLVASPQATILASRELEDLLSINSTSIADILQSQGIDYEVDFDPDAAIGDNGVSRDVVIALLITMGLIATATPLIRSMIERLTRKPVVIKELRLVPAESSSGDIMYDANGHPILYWVEVNRLLDPEIGNLSQSERLKLSAEAPMGIRFEIDSSHSQKGRARDQEEVDE
jgi:hypothetical protein